MTKLMTVQEAIDRLNFIEASAELKQALDKLPIHGNIDDTDTYQDLLDSTAEHALQRYLVNELNEEDNANQKIEHDYPEIGDIAMLLVKLNNPKL